MNHAAMLLDEVLLPTLGVHLANPAIEDIAINEPGAFWARGPQGWERHEAPDLDYETLEGAAILCGSLRKQDVGRSNPFCGGELHTGHRFQWVVPPAVPTGTVCGVMRRHSDTIAAVDDIPKLYDTSRWNQWATRGQARRRDSQDLLDLYRSGDVVAFVHAMVRSRRTVVLLGPTGAGKTFMGKVLLGDADRRLRIVTIEDAVEIALRHENAVRLLFSPGGEGSVTPADCHRAALRLRPDLIPVQELRDPYSAWIYANEIALAHPGSPTTAHGETAPEGARRVFGLLKGCPEGSSISDDVLLAMMGTAIDAFIPIGTDGAVRHIGEIWFADEAAERGETIADLLRLA